ncbi:GtrA family protein [Hyphococcus sp.]|uniref:GtrA family protein n=1 Tax=Hyphococcus sp. TaxID=2038636 RepID=UPI003CCBF284
MIVQIVRYCLVGVLNTCIGLGVIFTCMSVFKFSPGLSNAIGFLSAIGVSYSLNRRWTFQSDASVKSSLTGYGAICVLGFVLNLGALYLFLDVLNVNPYIAQIFSVGIYASFVFFSARILVFRNN